MKIENTSENKAKFFALYYGQEVAKITKGTYTHTLGSVHVVDSMVMRSLGVTTVLKYRYTLELKPISMISNEDAMAVIGESLYRHFQIDENDSRFGMSASQMFFEDEATFLHQPKTVDYLRSKGYALPWMGISLEELVKYGWVKLKATEI